MSQKKNFVIDTNVLLHDPEAFLKFPKSTVVLPLAVIEELDNMKRFHDDIGKNARLVIRLLDGLKSLGTGDLHSGVKLENGASVRVQMQLRGEFPPDNFSFSASSNSNRIILAAYNLQQQGETVIFISKDFAMRVKAEAAGLIAENYEYLKFSFDDVYRGIRKIEMEKAQIDLFYKDGALSTEIKDFYPNEYCLLTSPEHSSAVAKYQPQTQKLVSLLKINQPIWGITALNVEQKCAMDLLLRDDVKLITLIGQAGTGKTLMALACGLRKVFDEGVYNKILVSRPIVPLGKDIGYLPGLKEEKLFHWMQPIYDNLEFLCNSTGTEPNETLRWVTESKRLEMEAVTYIRGRSLPKVFMIIDEAQNLTPHELKTVVSRAGEGTKVILTGDPTQIDNPYLDKDSNGLTYIVGKFKDHKLFGHIYLDRTERSELAALAASLM